MFNFSGVSNTCLLHLFPIMDSMMLRAWHLAPGFQQPTKVTSREMSGLSGTDFARFRSVRSEWVGAVHDLPKV